MKFKAPLLVVTDMQRSLDFYRQVLGLRVILDFGANVTLSGGMNLQTLESWQGFINAKPGEISFGGRDAELYFEEDDFDGFLARLEEIAGISYVHRAVEHSWGQRAVRFYDPDLHIVEVGENIKAVCRRFFSQGLTRQEIAQRMDVSIKFVNSCLR